MMRKSVAFGLLWLCMSLPAAVAQERLDELLKSLEGIAFPLDPAVLSGLQETQDYKARTDAILTILKDRDSIHGRSDIDERQKTRIVGNALYLLDEYDLPSVTKIFETLSAENNWRTREKVLLAYLCAKRGIRLEANVVFLFESLGAYEQDLKSPANPEVAWTIRDVCDTLSYLGGLFVKRGDPSLLQRLFAYVSIAFGYPAEYLSDRLVEMFLKRPRVFVSVLAESGDETLRVVTNGLFFGIRNDSVRKAIQDLLQSQFGGVGPREQEVVAILTGRVASLGEQWAAEPSQESP